MFVDRTNWTRTDTDMYLYLSLHVQLDVCVCVCEYGIKALAPQKYQLIVHFSDNKHRRQEFIISGLAALRIRHSNRRAERRQGSNK